MKIKSMKKIERMVFKELNEKGKIKLSFECINENQIYDNNDNVIGYKNEKYFIIFDFENVSYTYYRKNKYDISYSRYSKYDLFNRFFHILQDLKESQNNILTGIKPFKEN